MTLHRLMLISLMTMVMYLTGCNQRTQHSPTPADEFSKNIRGTDARTPEEERDGFTLPQGFEVQLFASEPDIGKPLNMAFDARGRMWLTQSNEYPFPNEAGKDRITILEDTDGDGQADKFTTFADSLNIPIGITPVKGGAIAFSIPYVWFLGDHNGDDIVDERKVLLRGFGFQDTHGMINNFLRGLDGWIHADHGYRNASKVVGANSADTLRMTSGNTFRFLQDGSRVELTTTGRVNPFGLTYDDYGYMYGVDCHTSPIYQLIRGGDYPHFGKKPSGIGYAPFMMRHEYGSTALAGLDLYLSSDFPEEFQNNFYYGDVVMSRVLRSSFVMQGTTPVPQQETDFIISDDPWFRPVDVKLGPDGALYIADFYNRIIGHYEVPLDHPGRDRQRGRIWRVTYSGASGKSRDWTSANINELIDALGSANRTVRMLVADQLTDYHGDQAVGALRDLLESSNASAAQKRHALWILYRLKALPDEVMLNALQDSDETVRVHALEILFEYDNVSPELLNEVIARRKDASPHIQRMAVMILAKFPDPQRVMDLLELRKEVPPDDSHLVYAVRQSLRDQLRDEKVMNAVAAKRWTETDSRLLADILVGVNAEGAALYLLEHTRQYAEEEENFIRYARHIARYVPEKSLDQLFEVCRQKAGPDVDLQFTLFTSLQEGLGQRGVPMTQKGRQWASALAGDFFRIEAPTWRARPFENLPYPANPWQLGQLSPEEGLAPVATLTSDPEGIQTGEIRSPEFAIPDKLGFYLVGYKKEPLEGEEPSPPDNRVQLRLQANDEIVAEEVIDETRVRREVVWDLGQWVGQKGYLVLLDGSSTRREYVGIGGITPAVVQLPAHDPDQMIRRQLFATRVARDFRISLFASPLYKLAIGTNVDVLVRSAALDALLAVDERRGLSVSEGVLDDREQPDFLRERIIKSVAALGSSNAEKLLARVIPNVSYSSKKEIAMALARTSTGANLLFKAADRMELPPSILLDRKVDEQLRGSINPAQRTVLTALTRDVKAPDEEIQALIERRVAEYSRDGTSVDEGVRVFNQNCRACHEVKEQGGNIGPQLDGIGSWGIRALTEKIMDPNRNISAAFVSYSLRLKDGTTQTGLFRREEGNLLIFANVAGQEFSIPKDNIAERKATPFTLMPDRFAETLTAQDYNALLTYLLSLK